MCTFTWDLRRVLFAELVFCTEEKCDPVYFVCGEKCKAACTMGVWPSTLCSAFKQAWAPPYIYVIHLCRWTFWLVKQVWLIVMRAAAHRLQVCRFSGHCYCSCSQAHLNGTDPMSYELQQGFSAQTRCLLGASLMLLLSQWVEGPSGVNMTWRVFI